MRLVLHDREQHGSSDVFDINDDNNNDEDNNNVVNDSFARLPVSNAETCWAVQ
jgi:hypothetical protein